MSINKSPVLIAVAFANLGALVAGPLISLSFASSWTVIGHSLAYAIIYANCLAVMSGLLVPRLAHLAAARLYPVAAFIAIGSIAAAALGCLLAQAILTVLGVAEGSAFWPDFFSTLKLTALLGLVFGMGSFFLRFYSRAAAPGHVKTA